MHPGQPRGRRRRAWSPAAVAERLAVVVIKAGEHEQVVPVRRERLQGLGELKPLAFGA
jgi:hypothetical protein